MLIGFTVAFLSKPDITRYHFSLSAFRYFHRKDFEYVTMDTDSAYMALSGPLESIVKPELRREFYRCYGDWFPRPYCPKHADAFVQHKMSHAATKWTPHDCCQEVYKFDLRTPGLFKEEFQGDGIVALNSKTYYCWNNDGSTKHSSKGISKSLNQLTKEQYLKVLDTKASVCGINKGFVKKNGLMCTYSQLKTGLTYSYAKRKLCDDGVSTLPIDI